ncbi:MAG: hypothetical protein EA381_00695 [Planctomycetaceae bacterium]|nr:MAG: hypothetical protein EA381_00695 [Planctomycetaceae bacterium]
MKIPDKALCKLSKDQIAWLLPRLASELPDSRYLCRKCGRAAVEKWRLCKPQSIAKLLDQAGEEPREERPRDGFESGGEPGNGSVGEPGHEWV